MAIFNVGLEENHKVLVVLIKKIRVACRPNCLNFKTEAVHVDVYHGTAVFCNRVHYSTDTKKKCPRRGSTLLPPACEADALPSELRLAALGINGSNLAVYTKFCPVFDVLFFIAAAH